MIRTLFLAWQDPVHRRWYPVGKLTSNAGTYTFEYIGGALEAAQHSGFEPLPGFPKLETAYESNQLFPLFANRVLSPSRPEYKDVLEWLSMPRSEDDPVAILARSGGQRRTDSLEVFPCPEMTQTGEYQVHFLVHGLSHMPPDAAQRAELLKPGEPLLLMRDIQNPQDSLALALRTAERFKGDMYLVGYCPRYIRGDIADLLENVSCERVEVTVERVNLPPVPIQFRVLCRLKLRWPPGFRPFSTPEYLPVTSSSLARDKATTA